MWNRLHIRFHSLLCMAWRNCGKCKYLGKQKAVILVIFVAINDTHYVTADPELQLNQYDGWNIQCTVWYFILPLDPATREVSFFFVAQQPNSGLGRLSVQVSRSHTVKYTYTPSGTPLNEWSARRRGRYLHNALQTQDKNIYALRGITLFVIHPYLFLCLHCPAFYLFVFTYNT